MLEIKSKPRVYAFKFIQAGEDRDKQRAALAGCPVEWRDLVRSHIKIFKQRQGTTHEHKTK